MYLLETYDLNGSDNMAMDVAIGELLTNEVVLRFYTWKVPTLSLGKHQKVDDLDWDFIEKNGYEVVRRPSGGRAVLHWDEITYSIIIPKSKDLFNTTVLELYNLISSLIVDGLQKIGYPVKIVEGKHKATSHVCFQVPSTYEIVLNGIKVVGSAQMRTQEYILQHGSIILKPHEEVKYCFKTTRNLDIPLVGLYDHKIIPTGQIVESLKRSFESYFGLSKAFPYEDKLNEQVLNLSQKFKIYRN